jgi:hypothetical protein
MKTENAARGNARRCVTSVLSGEATWFTAEAQRTQSSRRDFKSQISNLKPPRPLRVLRASAVNPTHTTFNQESLFGCQQHDGLALH